ncbi:hypothetical protein F5Y01DRAFT_48903 [Xylaria sp. FL0043]|nr:hypothetical protein F5Y01DRAFT_48903 [Xylaria sp. FL0043]
MKPEVDLAILIHNILHCFVTLREDKMSNSRIVRFPHLSARDFIQRNPPPQGWAGEHKRRIKGCFKVLLRKFNCKKNWFGEPCNSFASERHDSTVYWAIYWIKHLSQIDDASRKLEQILAIHVLKEHFVQWLEVLDLHDLIPEALAMMSRLDSTLVAKVSPTIKLTFSCGPGL